MHKVAMKGIPNCAKILCHKLVDRSLKFPPKVATESHGITREKKIAAGVCGSVANHFKYFAKNAIVRCIASANPCEMLWSLPGYV